ncbi:MAG TPA: BON domain-containing protein [Candidatus Tenderia electrophaga]|uniref:BON domain-containing protein n=1 Tax=Candidatus Tenderia electrophaga TaxID=1748243 RepID=A0A832J4R8_9GAMM|nr:BON domain-containing protein [Candidatus Tenderia electrophaga]
MPRPIHSLFVILISAILISGCAAPVLVAGGAIAGATAVDRRDANTIIDDSKIALSIEEKIYTDDRIRRHIHVNVTSYNGVVLLTGEIPTMEMRKIVVNHAQHVAKVKKIYNETIIAPASDFKSRRQDTWITTKVKSALLSEKNINGLHFKVVTENQIVYLMGLVSRTEGDIAANAVRQVKGIKQIIKLFEYQDNNK